VDERRITVLPPPEHTGEPAIIAAPAPLRIKSRPAHPDNYSRATREPTLIVIHCTDGCEGLRKDDDEAAAIAVPGPLGRRVSFHYAVDADSCTRCVPDMLTAWHAGHTGNARGIGIELCGRANQTRAQWLDELSLPTLCIAARLVADLCREYHIPPVLVDVPGLVLGHRGITTHSMCGAAWHESDHYDPGPHFPLGDFVQAVVRALEQPSV